MRCRRLPAEVPRAPLASPTEPFTILPFDCGSITTSRTVGEGAYIQKKLRFSKRRERERERLRARHGRQAIQKQKEKASSSSLPALPCPLYAREGVFRGPLPPVAAVSFRVILSSFFFAAFLYYSFHHTSDKRRAGEYIRTTDRGARRAYLQIAPCDYVIVSGQRQASRGRSNNRVPLKTQPQHYFRRRRY